MYIWEIQRKDTSDTDKNKGWYMGTLICANSSNWWGLTEAQHGKTIMTSLWTDKLASTSLEISNCLSELYCKCKVQWWSDFITQSVFITYNRDLIACPWEGGMGKLLSVQSLIRHCCCQYNIAFRRIVLKRLKIANSDTTLLQLAHRDKNRTTAKNREFWYHVTSYLHIGIKLLRQCTWSGIPQATLYWWLKTSLAQYG